MPMMPGGAGKQGKARALVDTMVQESKGCKGFAKGFGGCNGAGKRGWARDFVGATVQKSSARRGKG
eukprot:scaffold10338_cov19-Tisochrysis_lutea.AAC.1